MKFWVDYGSVSEHLDEFGLKSHQVWQRSFGEETGLDEVHQTPAKRCGLVQTSCRAGNSRTILKTRVPGGNH